MANEDDETRDSERDPDLHAVRQGLRMVQPPDPEKLAAERAYLVELEGAGAGRRFFAYLRLMGPGYLQSAMTLGGGTASAALFAGAAFGYSLLWVAPVSMVIGVIMLSAISYQTLTTGMRPFEAMRRYAGAPFAWGWAFGALASSIIWHFPQYALASACLVDMGQALGVFDEGTSSNVRSGAMGAIVLVWAIGLSFLYGRSERAIRWYERALKYMVWGIVLCFGLVVFRTGVSDWGAIARGFFAFELPESREGVRGVALVMSGLAAAVGINMVFLYPYSLLARGWGRDHRRMARYDLYFGMFFPYLLATSLMVIASANTLYDGFAGSKMAPVEAAQSIATVVGPFWGRTIFSLGVLGMALSSISLQMLCAGFVCSEVFGWSVGSWKYRLGTLLPAPGVLGAVLWKDIAVYVATPTNIICGFLLPIAYLGFVLLQRSRAYLAGDLPRGPGAKLWFAGMVIATLFFTGFLGWYLFDKFG